jgi:aminoglycoside phosphotransferase (APT) family kinase protein/ABC-type phosphate/phosphonate transport system substrate-binding protein
LDERLGVGGLEYRQDPAAISGGWETYIHRFRLQYTPDLPLAFREPLVLRIYSGERGLPFLRHECSAQVHMDHLGYPVARPLLIEEDAELLGGPFMIMRQLPGRTLLEAMWHEPWRIISGPTQMALAHARLHELPTDGFPAPCEPFLDRQLARLDSLIAEYELDGLSAGLDWLCAHRPGEPQKPSIIHLDFHPLNLMFQDGRCEGVLDWSESDVGDRHADLGATLLLMKTAPIETQSAWESWSLKPGRWVLCRRYFRTYRRRFEVDDHILSYYVAWGALRRLCRYGQWLRAGPEVTGGRHSSLRHLSAAQVARVERCFFEQTSVAAQCEPRRRRGPTFEPHWSSNDDPDARSEKINERGSELFATSKGVARSIPLAVAGLLAIGAMSVFAGDKDPPGPRLRIGIVKTLFQGVPEPVVLAAMKPFEILVQHETGMSGEVSAFEDSMELAKQVAEHKVGFAVINGVEFGWARQRYRGLRPLMLAITQNRSLHAYVVVRTDKNVATLDALKGKALVLPNQNRLHCSLYLERQCRLRGARDVERFFSSITNTPDAEAAFDRVVDGRADATIGEDIAWARYSHRKPTRAARLKVIAKSESFPAPAVVYAEGGMDSHRLEQFRERMIHAHETAYGRELLTIWKITSFDPVPAGYAQAVADILKVYPAPEAVKVSKR